MHRTLVIGVFLAAVLVGYVLQFNVRSDLIDSCERSNVLRSQLYGFMRDAEKTRTEEAQRSTTPMDRRENLAAAARYRQRAEALVRTATDVAVEPGSVVVDCDQAFSKPWPF